MTHRHLEYSNYPPRFQFQYQPHSQPHPLSQSQHPPSSSLPPPRTPLPRKDPYSLTLPFDPSLTQFTKPWKYNDLANTSFEYAGLTSSDVKKNINTDYLKVSKEISLLRGEIDTMKAESRRLGDGVGVGGAGMGGGGGMGIGNGYYGGQQTGYQHPQHPTHNPNAKQKPRSKSKSKERPTYTPEKHSQKPQTALNKTLYQPFLPHSHKLPSFPSPPTPPLAPLDYKTQLSLATSKILQLQQKNTLLQHLLHSDTLSSHKDSPTLDLHNSNTRTISASTSNSLHQLFQLQSLKQLQLQKQQYERKKKDMEQILLIQNQKMKDKEGLIKVLSQKCEEGKREYEKLEKLLGSQGKRLEELEKVPKRVLQTMETTHQEIINKKDKEINILRTELNLAKELHKHTDKQPPHQLHNNKLLQENKRIKQELIIKQKELMKEKQSIIRLKAAQEVILKRVKDETMEKIAVLEGDIVNQKESFVRNQGCNDDQIRSLKERVGELMGESGREKERWMREGREREREVRGLEERLEREIGRARGLEDGCVGLRERVGECEEVIRRLEGESEGRKEAGERQNLLVKEKEGYQRLLVAQEGTIDSLKQEAANFKGEVLELRARVGREEGLRGDKQALAKILSQKEKIIRELQTQNSNLHRQCTNQHDYQKQKQNHLKTILSQQTQLTSLKSQTTLLRQTALTTKATLEQNHSLSALLTLKQTELTQLQSSLHSLTLLSSRVQPLEQQNLSLVSRISSLQSDIQRLRQESSLYQSLSSTTKTLAEEKETYQKLINSQNAVICSNKEEIGRLVGEVAGLRMEKGEKEYWMKVAGEREAEVRGLRGEVAEYKKLKGKESQWLQEQSRLQDEIKSLTSQTLLLQQTHQQTLHEHSLTHQTLTQQLTTQLHTLNQELHLKTSSLTQLQHQSSHLHTILSQLQSENTYLTNENRNIQELAKELERERVEKERWERELRGEVESNGSLVRNLQGLNERLMGQRDQLLRDKCEEEKKGRKLQAEVVQLGRELAELKQREKKNQPSNPHPKPLSSLPAPPSLYEPSPSVLKDEIKQQSETISTLQGVIRTLEQGTQLEEANSKIVQLEVMLEEMNELLVREKMGKLDRKFEEMRLV